MSELGGLWKHQNNPACFKKCQSLRRSTEAGHYTKEDEEDKSGGHYRLQDDGV